jgi:hypothetical protein
MLIVLLVAGLWSAGLLLVAGLCAAARRGDREALLTVVPGEAPQEPGSAAIRGRAPAAAVPAAPIAA